jgi:hypothetical protein
MRAARIVVVFAAVFVAGLLAAALGVRALKTEPPPPAWANDYDLSAAEPEAIAPGTVIERGPPPGWSHLIIKALPRVKQSEVPKLPDPVFAGGRAGLAQKVSWMFTAFTADVVKEQQGSHTRHRLRAIGLGLGANVNGRDTVLTVEYGRKAGLNLGLNELVLQGGYKVQKQARVVIHGPSFALLDTPVSFRCDGEKNRMVRFRYGLLVDAATGRLDVFGWRVGTEGDGCSDLARAVLLNDNTIDEAELLVDPAEFSAIGAPNEVTFGVDDLPPRRLEVTIPVEARTLAGQSRFTPDEARALEAALRKLLP